MSADVPSLDSDLAQKQLEKYDTAEEAKIQKWIAEVLKQKESELFGEGFMKGIKNGEVMCKLVNALKPGTIAKVNTSNMPFKQMENINNFLNAAKQLGVADYELFRTVDLFEEKNPAAVLVTFPALSRMTDQVLGPKLARKNSRSFTEQQLREAKNTPSLQSGFTGGANASGMSYGARRQIDAKAGSGDGTPSQQSGFSGGANASGVSYGARRQIDAKTGSGDATPSQQSGFSDGANASGVSYGSRRQIDAALAKPVDNSVSQQSGFVDGANAAGISFGSRRQIDSSSPSN